MVSRDVEKIGRRHLQQVFVQVSAAEARRRHGEG
jgi:hypothetical protein